MSSWYGWKPLEALALWGRLHTCVGLRDYDGLLLAWVFCFVLKHNSDGGTQVQHCVSSFFFLTIVRGAPRIVSARWGTETGYSASFCCPPPVFLFCPLLCMVCEEVCWGGSLVALVLVRHVWRAQDSSAVVALQGAGVRMMGREPPTGGPYSLSSTLHWRVPAARGRLCHCGIRCGPHCWRRGRA